MPAYTQLIAMRFSAQCLRPYWLEWLSALLAVLMSLVLLARPAVAADAVTQRWDLRDDAGQRWGLVLFAQPDPAYPKGWRLRLTAGLGSVALDHHQPLQLDDGLGHHWILGNRSLELVQPGEGRLPIQSAQFDLGDLQPRPSDGLPLHLRVALEDGVADLVLGPDQLTALHTLPAST